MTPRVIVSREEGPIAVVTLSNPPVNALHPDLLRQLTTVLRDLQEDASIKGIVLHGASDKFSAGADITQFHGGSGYSTGGARSIGFSLFHQVVEMSPKPIVACLQGVALGGGCELSISCHYRIAVSKTKIGLPELQLGIIPGWGGTQRLPRLVGFQKALEMMLTSKPVTAEEGRKLGLIDKVVTDPSELLQAGLEAALAISNGELPFQRTLSRNDKLPPLQIAKFMAAQAKKMASKKAPGLRHPMICIDVALHGVAKGGISGLQAEYDSFEELMASDVSKSLVHVFLGQRAINKVPGVSDSGLSPREVKTVVVLGGGLMGSGIATALVLAGKKVILKEINDKFLQAGLDRIRGNIAKKLKSTVKAEQIMGSQTMGTTGFDGFNRADMVIEAVLEDAALKQRIFRELEDHCPRHCILATNTSTINIDIVGQRTRQAFQQGRIIGAHFFSPAHLMPLLEIVKSSTTSPQTILDTMHLGRQMKKTNVVVGNCTGFAVNRAFFPYGMAAIILGMAGVDIYQIDAVIKGFGMPMGPFRLNDLVGMQVCFAVMKNFVNSFRDRAFDCTDIIKIMLSEKRLGESTGTGFYIHDRKSRNAKPDPANISRIMSSGIAAMSKPISPSMKGKSVSAEEIVAAIFFPVVNEACRILDEGIVCRAVDMDIASIMAMGFPAFRGGLIWWGDNGAGGARAIVQGLELWARRIPEAAHFFRPAECLRRCSAHMLPLTSLAPYAEDGTTQNKTLRSML